MNDKELKQLEMREKYKNEIEELKKLFNPICRNKTFKYALMNVKSINVKPPLATVFFEVWGAEGRMQKEKSFYKFWKEINN